MSKIIKSVIFSIAVLTITTVIVKAGVLTPSASPTATSYTLTDIYNRLSTNATATEANHDLSNSASPTATFYTLAQIYDKIPTIDASKLMDDTTYLGTTGTIATETLSASSGTVSAGYYSATTLETVDTDLTAANINSSTVIFGVTGTLTGVELHTGQSLCHNEAGTEVVCSGTEQDGDLDGESKSYTDNSDDTVTDDQTGLIWQKYDQNSKSWEAAMTYCAGLTLGGSSDWRLPTALEGITMLDYSCMSSVPSHCYSDFQNIALDWTNTTATGSLWTSTSRPDLTTLAHSVKGGDGYLYSGTKTNLYDVRCVRDN